MTSSYLIHTLNLPTLKNYIVSYIFRWFGFYRLKIIRTEYGQHTCVCKKPSWVLEETHILELSAKPSP